ncbi:MAG TPA: eL32 family ribosomal protein, partial [Methanosarcina vacuolata]|nr:eL32 family ribosomal protein [Methanosarcina vacuolata]
AELELVDPSYEAIRIASTVGSRKKAVIITKAGELGIKVLNPGRSE